MNVSNKTTVPVLFSADNRPLHPKLALEMSKNLSAIGDGVDFSWLDAPRNLTLAALISGVATLPSDQPPILPEPGTIKVIKGAILQAGELTREGASWTWKNLDNLQHIAFILGVFGFAVLNYRRATPKAEEDQLRRDKIQQRAIQDEPTLKDVKALKEVSAFCAKALANKDFERSVEKQEMAIKAVTALLSLNSREKLRNDFDTTILNKVGLNLSTLRITGLLLPVEFPLANWMINIPADGMEKIPCLRGFGRRFRESALQKQAQNRANTKTFEKRARFEKRVPPTKRAQLEEAILSYMEMAGWNVPLANLKRSNMSHTKVLLSNFEGAEIPLADASHTEWIKNDTRQLKAYGVNLKNSRWYNVNGRWSNFRPYEGRGPEKKGQISDLSGMVINNTDFDPKREIYVVTSKNDLRDSDFFQANLSNMDWTAVNVRRSNFKQANLDGAIWRNIDPQGANFEDAIMTNMSFPQYIDVLDEENKKLTYSKLMKQSAKTISFENSSLVNTKWDGTDLGDRISLAGADVSGADFTRALYKGIPLSEIDIKTLITLFRKGLVCPDQPPFTIKAYYIKNPPKFEHPIQNNDEFLNAIGIKKERPSIFERIQTDESQ